MSKTVAVVGATGAVGAEMIRCLEKSSIDVGELRVFASERSAGRTVQFGDDEVTIAALSEDAFEGVDIALFASESDISKKYGAIAARAGAVVVDNSSAFRMDPDYPLVVPEVNGDLISSETRIIANPNCVAAIMVMALWPLHQAGGVKRVIASTYQSASGAGAAAMKELEDSTRAYLNGESFEPSVLPHPYAFNLFSHNSQVGPNGYNTEEMKMIQETRKLLSAPSLRITATAVRVPVFCGHSESVNIETEKKLTAQEVRTLLREAPGILLCDEPENNVYPMAIDAVGKDATLVGRIREDDSVPNGINLWIVADNLRKGAALNAVQIAEILIRDYL